MTKSPHLRIAAFAVGMLVLAAIASATSLQQVSVTDLTRGASAVARATVTNVYGGALDDDEMIYTFADLRVDEVYRGTLPDQVTVRVPGGSFGGTRIEIAGMPDFRPGYQVLVFLTRWDDGAYKVMGYVQGLSEIRGKPGEERLIGGAAHKRCLPALAKEIRTGIPDIVELEEVQP